MFNVSFLKKYKIFQFSFYPHTSAYLFKLFVGRFVTVFILKIINHSYFCLVCTYVLIILNKILKLLKILKTFPNGQLFTL